jgi:hypothetical protein
VPDHDPQPREAIEHPGGDDAQQVHPGLDGEPVDRTVQPGLQQRADHRPRRGVRVQVDRRVQVLRGLEDGPELRVVQVLALGVGVDDDAHQAELASAALDFLGRGGRVLGRDRGQPAEPVRVPSARLGQLVVGQRGHGDSAVPVQDLDARAGQRDDLPVDAGGVHVGDPPFAEVLQAGQDRGGPFGLAAHVEALQADEAGVVGRSVGEHGLPQGDELGRRERLFGRDPQITGFWVHGKNLLPGTGADARGRTDRAHHGPFGRKNYGLPGRRRDKGEDRTVVVGGRADPAERGVLGRPYHAAA